MVKIEFGWPLHKRLSYFTELEKDDKSKLYDQPIEFMDQNLIRPVWRIPLTLPKYRLMNGRTASLQLEWIAANPEKGKDFFQIDPEREEVQEVQHTLLKKLIREKDLLPFFENAERKQVGYLILDDLGFVINGNRRLCTWRELYHKDPSKYSHFEYIDILVLPHSDDKAIDKLEAHLQLEHDVRADYSWHALANMMLERMKLHGLDERALADFYDLSESEVKKMIEMRYAAEEYLISRGKDGQWSGLGDKFAFEKLVDKRKQLSNAGEKRLFEVQAYTLIDNPTGGRLYDYIPDLYKYTSVVREKLLEKFPINIVDPTEDDPLGSSIEDEINLNLANIIDESDNRNEALDIIKDTIETQNSIVKGENTARYVLRQLQKANASIQSAFAGTKNKNIVKEGIRETVNSIEVSLNAIKKWLDE